jgi:hypothetical protein
VVLMPRPLYPPPAQLVQDLQAGLTYEVENLWPEGAWLTADARPTFTPLLGGPEAVTGRWSRRTFAPGAYRFIPPRERR